MTGGQPPAPRRSFIDSRGVLWEVREVLAHHGEVRCLRFDSQEGVRESCPIPDEWGALPGEELERLCRRATPRPEGRRPERQ